MNLTGRAALVTGGARIGATVALALAEKGCDVVLTYRSSRSSTLKTVESILARGLKARAFKCDVTSDAHVKKTVNAAARFLGHLDIVINMASVYEQTPFAKLRSAQWTEAIESNLVSAHRVVSHAVPYLQQRGGRVVNISDWVAASGRPRYKGFLPYYVAKKGVIGLTEAQALELAPRILVNAIAPGPILPPTRITNEEVDDIVSVTPLGKWGGAGEIAKAVIFLCETDFVTGECIRVDGGRHLL